MGDEIKIGTYRANKTFGVQSFDLTDKEGADEFSMKAHALLPLWTDILEKYTDVVNYKETVFNKRISLLETSKTEDIDTNLGFENFEDKVKELEDKVSESIVKYEEQVKILREYYNKLGKKGGTDKVDVLEYLKSADLSKLGSEFDLNKKIYETCKGSDKEPSRRQQYYLDKMYEALTGEMPVHEKSSLSDVEKTACEWITTKYKGDSFAKKVCKTILSKGEYSAKQKRFLDEAIQLMKESGDI